MDCGPPTFSFAQIVIHLVPPHLQGRNVRSHKMDSPFRKRVMPVKPHRDTTKYVHYGGGNSDNLSPFLGPQGPTIAMTQTTTDLRERFTDLFNASPAEGRDMTFAHEGDAEKVRVSADDVVLFLPNDVPKFGWAHRDEYQDVDGWTMGYTEIDGDTTSVYVFNLNGKEHAVQADYVEQIAELANETPAAMANRAMMNDEYYHFPVRFDLTGDTRFGTTSSNDKDVDADDNWILVSPVMSDDIELE